jgi:arsenate reductase (glutaredoxin)
LTARGVEFESVNYIDKPFSASELKDLLDRAGLKAQDALRRNEPAYKQLVAGKELSDDEVLKVMAAHPELVQRPIVVRDEKAVLARPIENLTKLGL